jgi:hypothetical protein
LQVEGEEEEREEGEYITNLFRPMARGMHRQMLTQNLGRGGLEPLTQIKFHLLSEGLDAVKMQGNAQ